MIEPTSASILVKVYGLFIQWMTIANSAAEWIPGGRRVGAALRYTVRGSLHLCSFACKPNSCIRASLSLLKSHFTVLLSVQLKDKTRLGTMNIALDKIKEVSIKQCCIYDNSVSPAVW